MALRRPTPAIVVLLTLTAGADSTAAPGASAGALEGVVRLIGDSIPGPTQVVNTTDPAVCGEAQSLEDLAVASPSGGVAHVIVSVTDVPEDRAPVTLDTLVLDNRDCRFVPHAAVVTVGSTIRALNSDSLLHTTHYYGALRGNISLPVAGLDVPRTARRPGIIVVKCDVHGWMQAFVRVDPHDLHAVTDTAGRYRIDGIPAGTYRVEFWHERLGRRVRDVTITAAGTASLDLGYALDNEEPSESEEHR